MAAGLRYSTRKLKLIKGGGRQDQALPTGRLRLAPKGPLTFYERLQLLLDCLPGDADNPDAALRILER